MLEELVKAINENNIENIHAILKKIKNIEGQNRYEDGVVITLTKASSNNNLEIIKSIFSILKQDQINELGARGLSAAEVFHSNKEIIDYFISNIDLETLIQEDGFELPYSKFKPQKEENIDNTEKLLMEKQREILAIKIAYSLYYGFDLTTQTQKALKDAEIVTSSLELLKNRLVDSGLYNHETINEYKEFIETKYANIINPEKIFQITSFISKLEDNISTFESLLYDELYGKILTPYIFVKDLAPFCNDWSEELKNLEKNEFKETLIKKMIEAQYLPAEIKKVEASIETMQIYIDNPEYKIVGKFLAEMIKENRELLEKILIYNYNNALLSPDNLAIILNKEIHNKFYDIKREAKYVFQDQVQSAVFDFRLKKLEGDIEKLSLSDIKSIELPQDTKVYMVKPLTERKIEEKIEFKIDKVEMEFTPLVLTPIATLIKIEDDVQPLGDDNNTES